MKKTQREVQKLKECQERREQKLRIRLSAGIGPRLLTSFSRRGPHMGFTEAERGATATCGESRNFQKGEKVTVNVKCPLRSEETFLFGGRKPSPRRKGSLSDITEDTRDRLKKSSLGEPGRAPLRLLPPRTPPRRVRSPP